MQVSSADFNAPTLQRQFASDALRENPHARHAANEHEERKVEEVKSQEVVAEQEAAKAAQHEKAQAGSEATHHHGDGDGHGHSDAGQNTHGEDSHALSGPDFEKRIQEELSREKDKKAFLFDQTGQARKSKPQSSIVDVFG